MVIISNLHCMTNLQAGFAFPLDNLHVKLNVDLGKENKIFHHSSKEHLKISKLAKFGW